MLNEQALEAAAQELEKLDSGANLYEIAERAVATYFSAVNNIHTATHGEYQGHAN